MTALKFAKGGAAKSPVRTPDTMVSTDTVEVLLGISEGPIKGLANGARSFMADDTPLENESGEANFQNFELDVWPGSEAGHVVTLDLGGFSNPKSIGVTLAQNTAVVRTGQTAGIDAVDFRMVVGQLLKQTDEGSFTNRLTVKFEVKRTTDAAWTLAWVNEPSTTSPGGASGGGAGTGGGGGYTPGGSGVGDIDGRTIISFNGPGIDMGDRTTYRAFGRVNDLLTFDGDVQTVVTAGVPVAPPANPDLPAVAVNSATDGVYRWVSGGWTPDATTPSTGFKVLTDGRRMYDRSDVPPTGARPGDLWLKLQLGILQIILVWNGGTWVKPSEYQASAPPVASNGIWSIDDKVSSPTPKDIRVFLPNPGPTDIWEYRVTKLSADSGTEEFSEIQWESVQEISRTPMSFSGVAMARVIGRASDQFTALPQWTGDWLGRVVKVASNYDPVAKTYAGIWDGLYKIEWTDNNAWIFQDFVENDRYGLSSVFPHTVNKWKIYEFAQHCDVKVLRPDGSLRPRWTYNDYIQEPRDAKELASYIAGSAGARYVDDGNGVVEVVIDKDDPAIAIFTPENIGEEGFAYSYTDRLTRANEITVEFVNPALNWQRDKRIVRDDADIAIYGRIPENFIAVGCTDVDEALARARRRLIGGLTEKEINSFTTNRKGRFLAEWSVILCGDPEMGRGITGRIRAITGARSVTLRDPLSFEPGITYWASFDIVNPDYPISSAEPFKLERRQITNAAGAGQTTLTFASDLPALPEYATFILEAPGLAGFPKPYRVTGLGDDSGTGDQIRVTCLELNRNKWSFIDTGPDQGDIIYSDFSSKIVLPPVNPTLVLTSRARGTGATRVIEVRWEKSPSSWVRRYKVYHAVNGVPQAAVDATGVSIEIEGAESGTHTFAIVAIDIRGRESLPLTLTYNVTGDARPVDPPTNLVLVGGLLPTVFEDISPKVTWDAPPASPNFKNYRLVISDTSSSAHLRTVELATELEYRYDFLMNRDDGAGTATRDLTFTLFAVDQDDNLSPPVVLSINNPAPFAPTIQITPAMGGINVVLSPSTERDVVGALLSVSTVSGATLINQDAYQGSFFVPIPDGELRFVKAAYYDKFSNTDLFWSAEASVTRGGLAGGDLPRSAIDAQGNLVLQQFYASVAEQARRHQAGIATHELIDHIGVVDPVSGDVVMSGENIRIGEETLDKAVAKVDRGFNLNGEVQVPIPRDVSVLSGTLNEMVSITAEGEILIEQPTGGTVSGGQVVRVTEATGFLGHDAFIRRSALDSNQGGRLFLQKPLINTTLTGDLAVDVYQSALRIFDASSLYGVTLPLTAFQPSIGGRIVVSTAAGVVTGDVASTTALRAPYARIGNDPGDGYLTLVEGDATYSGRMEFFNAAGGRLGYVGLGTSTTLLMAAETGKNWAFDKRLDMLAGAAITGTLSVSGLSSLNGGAAITGALTVSAGAAITGALTVSTTLTVTGFINTTANGYKQSGATILYGGQANNAIAVGASAAAAWMAASAVNLRSIAIGNDALAATPTSAAILNVAIGPGALQVNTSGATNFALGSSALNNNLSGSNNVAVGSGAMAFNTTGHTNIGLGNNALGRCADGQQNVAIGPDAGLWNSSAFQNVSVGVSAGSGAGHATPFSSTGSVAIGYRAGINFGNASHYNTLIGYYAGYNTSTGQRNIYIGQWPTTSNANVTTGSKNIVIGNDIQVPSATADGQLNIGNLIYGTGVDGTGATPSSGNLGVGGVPETKFHVRGTIRSRAGAVGYVDLISGDATNTGRLELVNAAGTRYGYIGIVNTTTKVINFVAENSATFGFSGGVVSFSVRPIFNGATPYDTLNLALTGDVTSVAGSLATTLATVNGNVGSFGSATAAPTFTVNGKGLVTAAGSVTITPAWSSVTGRPTSLLGYNITAADVLATLLTVDGVGTGLDADLLQGQTAGFYRDAANLNAGIIPAARMPAHTGDVTSVAGATALTLATVNATTGTFGSASVIPVLTVNGKGLVTAVATAAVAIPWSAIVSGVPTTRAGYGITDVVSLTATEAIGGVKTFSSIPVAPGLATVAAAMHLKVDTGQGFYFDVNGTAVALLQADGRLSLNAITMGGLGLGEWTTWSPTPTAESGTATGLASVYAEVERHGKSVTVNFAVSQTAIGTGAAAILVPLPYAAKASRNYFGSGKNLNTGADLRVEAVGSNLRITAANSYPMGSGAESLAGSITYQCA